MSQSPEFPRRKPHTHTHKLASVPCHLASDPVLHVGSDAASFVLLQSASGPVANGASGGAGGGGVGAMIIAAQPLFS